MSINTWHGSQNISSEDDLTEDEAILESFEQEHIEAEYEKKIKRLNAEKGCRKMNEIDDWDDHGWKKPTRHTYGNAEIAIRHHNSASLRAIGVTGRLENSFNIIICDDPRRYDPWPTEEDLYATPIEFTRSTRYSCLHVT